MVGRATNQRGLYFARWKRGWTCEPVVTEKHSEEGIFKSMLANTNTNIRMAKEVERSILTKWWARRVDMIQRKLVGLWSDPMKGERHNLPKQGRRNHQKAWFICSVHSIVSSIEFNYVLVQGRSWRMTSNYLLQFDNNKVKLEPLSVNFKS